MRQQRNILFYDGFCVLCNQMIQWLLKLDRKGVFELMPQHSDEAKSYMGEGSMHDEVVLWASGKVYGGVDAIMHAFKLLGKKWRFLVFFMKLMPRSVLKRLYHLVASNRYQWFGHPSCRIS
jgi:predicted DCC family thiol-disulfide oxidoreductase YuxK